MKLQIKVTYSCNIANKNSVFMYIYMCTPIYINKPFITMLNRAGVVCNSFDVSERRKNRSLQLIKK